MMNLDEPPFLAVGTEVSAKYKGAFCEAKIRKISKHLKCKVQYYNGISEFVTDDAVKGQLKVGATVDIKCSDKKELVQATIKKIQDLSQYTVVFDDGDVTCLKRTALCLKSGKHFAARTTLDNLPLSHPEHIGVTPVKTTIVQGGRRRKSKKSFGESVEVDTSAMDEKCIGKVVCVEASDKRKVKDNWFPGLIVAPTSQSSVKINLAEDYLVRSFKDGKYITVPKKETTKFTREIGARVENSTLKTAVEKALLFLENNELPPHWDRDLLFGINTICNTTDSEAFDSNNSDEESIEEKDHFVAQLIKFMDERGTPLNQSPTINEKDVDLYKLFKVVNSCGGYNKVNKGKLWKLVANKSGHAEQSYFSVKHCYEQYLYSFGEFYRKLGCTMLSHPRGVRSSSRFSRNLIRDVDKVMPSTSTAIDKNKCVKSELNDKKNKDFDIARKTAVTAVKAEENLLQKNVETSKKGVKKKENVVNRISRNKLSVKLDPDMTETKDTVINYETKKEIKGILKTEIINKELDSDVVDKNVVTEDKKAEKKILTRNLLGKSVRKTTKKEKVAKVKYSNTGLIGMRKMRAFKEQIKTFVKGMTPFKKSKSGIFNTQQDASNKGNPDEKFPKLKLSKTEEDLSTKSRIVSVLNDHADSDSMVQLTQTELLVENKIKIKKDDGCEKKKTIRKKKTDKEEKPYSSDIIPTPINIENVPFDKNSPVKVGDNLVVYYGDKQITTYDAKVINVCDIEGVKKYYVHYKGWNSRYDEWIDGMRIALKKKDPEPGPDEDNVADFSKISPPEQKQEDPKKITSITSRTRRSVTPLTSNSSIKKSPISNSRPTRKCTLTDRPLFNIDNSDSEEESTMILRSPKLHSKKKVIKAEPGVVTKTKPLVTDYQRNTYPSKEVLIQQNVPKKLKSRVLKIQLNKSEDVLDCEKVNLKPLLKPNTDIENLEVLKKSEIFDGIQIESKIDPNHLLLEKSERNDLKHNSGSSKFEGNEEDKIKSESLAIPTTSSVTSILYYSSSSEDDQLKKVTDVIASSLDDKSNESKISGTDFDLNKIRSEMKGLMPTSSNSNDIVENTKSFLLDQQIKIKGSKINEPVTDVLYEFKGSESCSFDKMSSTSEEKTTKSVRYDSPTLFNFEKSSELPIVLYSPAQVEEVDQNISIIPFVANRNTIYSSDNNVKINVNENINKIRDPIMINQSDNEFNESQNLKIRDVTRFTSNITDVKQIFQDEVNFSDLKYEVLDLCMKPHKSPLNKIFSMPEQTEINHMIVEDDGDDEDDDDDDDDELKLVIAENDKIETDKQIDSDNVIIEEHNSSSEKIDKNIEAQSLSSSPPSIHNNIALECKSSFQVERDISIPLEAVDENTSCSESIQSSHIFSHFEDHLSQNKVYIDTIKNFDFNSKIQTVENKEITEPATQHINKPLNNDKPKKFDFKFENFKNKYDEEKTMVLPELQCREEIIDEDTLNVALAIEYSYKAAEYDIHKPSTSKGFIDAIHQPGIRKDSFNETYPSSDAKYSFFEANQAVKNICYHTGVHRKSSLFDPNIPSCSWKDFYGHNIPSTSKNSFYEKSLPSTSKDFYDHNIPSTSKNSFYEKSLPSTSKDFYDHNIPSTSKSSFYENSLPSTSKGFYDHNSPSTSKSRFYENSLPTTSKSFYNLESDINSVLFCEETIPGSPTAMSEEQEDRKKSHQALYKEEETSSAMFAINQSFCKSMFTLTSATEEEVKNKVGATLDQKQPLAKISGRNLGKNIKESLPTEPRTIVEKSVKLPKKHQSKRRTCSLEKNSKRSKLSTATGPIPSAGIDQNPNKDIPQRPTENEKLSSFVTYVNNQINPDMNSSRKQEIMVDGLNEVKKHYAKHQVELVQILKNKKKIEKQKKAKAAAAAAAAAADSAAAAAAAADSAAAAAAAADSAAAAAAAAAADSAAATTAADATDTATNPANDNPADNDCAANDASTSQ